MEASIMRSIRGAAPGTSGVKCLAQAGGLDQFRLYRSSSCGATRQRFKTIRLLVRGNARCYPQLIKRGVGKVSNAESEQQNTTGNLAVAAEPRTTIVGVGASAGGIKALQRFFEALPAEPGVAFVV